MAAEKAKRQSDLAVILNLSSMAISRRFRGETPFTPEELITLSRHFGVPVGTFFGEAAHGAVGRAA